MGPDYTFRLVLIIGSVILVPILLYHRIKSQATGERLDRWQEGPFILFTLRPIGIAHMIGLITFMVDPSSMAWASVPLPVPVRWMGVAAAFLGGALVLWAFRSLGGNLTDTVVTRKAHTLVTRGPYQWVRHPFYDAVTLLVVANALTTANWFLFVTGILTVVLLVVRTSIEEAHLLRRFGDSYGDYMRRTGRFIPRTTAPYTRPAASRTQ